MKKVLRHIIPLLLLLWLASCEEKVDLTYRNPDPVLVVEGQVSDIDSITWVRLSYIQNYGSREIPDFTVEKNAKVELYEDSTKVGNLIFVDSTKRFETAFTGKAGSNYFVVITATDGTEYRSVPEWIETVPRIDSLYSVKEDELIGGGQEYAIKIITSEPPGPGDAYQWKVFINGQYQDTPDDINIADDRFVDGQPFLLFDVYFLSEERYEEFAAESPDGKVVISVQQIKISRTYFDYMRTILLQTDFVGGPFDAPPAEIRGNVHKTGDVNDLALGYFSAVSIDTASVEIIQ